MAVRTGTISLQLRLGCVDKLQWQLWLTKQSPYGWKMIVEIPSWERHGYMWMNWETWWWPNLDKELKGSNGLSFNSVCLCLHVHHNFSQTQVVFMAVMEGGKVFTFLQTRLDLLATYLADWYLHLLFALLPVFSYSFLRVRYYSVFPDMGIYWVMFVRIRDVELILVLLSRSLDGWWVYLSMHDDDSGSENQGETGKLPSA